MTSLVGQSGGVDEEFFTKSFEDVHKVQVGIKSKGFRWHRYELKVL